MHLVDTLERGDDHYFVMKIATALAAYTQYLLHSDAKEAPFLYYFDFWFHLYSLNPHPYLDQS